jgi:RNA recognition motif-containing protein
MEKNDLWDELDRVARVADITMPKDPSTGRPRGFAFVEFDTPRDAQRAMDEYEGRKMFGRFVRLDWDEGIEAKRASGKLGKGSGGGGGGQRKRSRSPRSWSRSPRRQRRDSRSPPYR